MPPPNLQTPAIFPPVSGNTPIFTGRELLFYRPVVPGFKPPRRARGGAQAEQSPLGRPLCFVGYARNSVLSLYGPIAYMLRYGPAVRNWI
jgi:hypothetical protein